MSPDYFVSMPILTTENADTKLLQQSVHHLYPSLSTQYTFYQLPNQLLNQPPSFVPYEVMAPSTQVIHKQPFSYNNEYNGETIISECPPFNPPPSYIEATNQNAINLKAINLNATNLEATNQIVTMNPNTNPKAEKISIPFSFPGYPSLPDVQKKAPFINLVSLPVFNPPIDEPVHVNLVTPNPTSIAQQEATPKVIDIIPITSAPMPTPLPTPISTPIPALKEDKALPSSQHGAGPKLFDPSTKQIREEEIKKPVKKGEEKEEKREKRIALYS